MKCENYKCILIFIENKGETAAQEIWGGAEESGACGEGSPKGHPEGQGRSSAGRFHGHRQVRQIPGLFSVEYFTCCVFYSKQIFLCSHFVKLFP